jgi:hypothetical protein
VGLVPLVLSGLLKNSVARKLKRNVVQSTDLILRGRTTDV